MEKLAEHFKSSYNSVANSNSVVVGDNYRFTILTSQLIRLEFNKDGEFEDRPTQKVLNRDFPDVEYRVIDSDCNLEIITEHIHLKYNKNGFTKNNLYIDVKGQFATYGSRWYYGEPCKTLKGTCTTLDEIDGEAELDEGLLSKEGYSFFTDNDSLVLKENGWVEVRDNESIDTYFLGYGHDYYNCLKDFYKLCGPTPSIPRYSLGNWWSRYWKYTDDSLKALMSRFKAEDVPFSICVIDMDWHKVEIDPKYGSGWTGYSWNRDFFKDPKEMLNWLHNNGYRVTLNLHPASGVRAHEDSYLEMAKALGVDYTNEDPINFEISDPKFLEAYFKYLHHPHEEIGVDFWWIDWQQGGITAVPEIDPLWMLNHYHFKDITRDNKNGLIFSRYSGIGSHRYPVGFSGDTILSWDSYAYQPYFTATASNVGYCWWSHDIGGHMHGSKDGELTTRWVQYGVLSPINRLHSSSNSFMSKEPWNFNKEEEGIIKEQLRFRHKLIPYIYTMNYRLSELGEPFVRPLYYNYPDIEDSYNNKSQYFFGSELMVAIITSKIDDCLKLAKQRVWLPKGVWTDFFTGKRYVGDRYVNMYRNLENQIVLGKEGSIVPLSWDTDIDNPESLDFVIFPGFDGEFELVEDKGDFSTKATTLVELKDSNSLNSIVKIHKVTGDLSAIPESRTINLIFKGVKDHQDFTVLSSDNNVKFNKKYTEETNSLEIFISNYSKDNSYTVTFNGSLEGEDNSSYKDKIFKVLNDAEIMYYQKEEIFNLCKAEKTVKEIIYSLQTYGMDSNLLGAILEHLI